MPSPNAGVGLNYVYGVSAVSANDIWAVGYFQQILNSTPQTLVLHWDGSVWSIMPSPNIAPRENILYGVSAVSANDVWAVGLYYNNTVFYQKPLAMHWDGTAWSVVPSPAVGSFNSALGAVSATSTSDIWAVGEYLTYNNGYRNQPLVEHWNGSSWGVVPSPDQGLLGGELRAVSAVSANDVWAVGAKNYYQGVATQALIIHWNGSVWSGVALPDLGSYANLSGVDALSANDAWAVGGNVVPNTGTTLTLHWDGTTWSVVPSPNPGLSSSYLNGVSAVSSSDVWAVGYGNGLQTLTEHFTSPCLLNTPTPTATSTATFTPTPTATDTPEPTSTATPTATPLHPLIDYFALGDSVASGHGLMDDGSPCRRSLESYPRKLARLLADRYETVDFHIFACSGATAARNPDRERYKTFRNQVDDTNASLTDGTPSLVSITLGANDFDWVNWRIFLDRLYWNNENTYRRWVDDTVATVKVEVKGDVQRLLQHENVAVVLTEYYNPVNTDSVFFLGPGNHCILRNCYDRTEYAINELNGAYIQIWDELGRPSRLQVTAIQALWHGHESPSPTCGGAAPGVADTWVQYRNDPNSNSDPGLPDWLGHLGDWGPWRGDCFHPNDTGASQYASAVNQDALRMDR